jgi:hypothetical protein
MMKRLQLAVLTLVITISATLIGTASTAQAATLPSCTSNPKYTGSAGVINFGETANGSFIWGGEMTPITLDPGTYVISVYAGSKVKDGKNGHYLYFPHGSLPPSVARPGYRMYISVTHVSDANGQTYVSIPNGCIM